MDHSRSSMPSSSERPTCKITMLWNWSTVDACFISDWQIRSVGTYAGILIVLFFLVILVEGVRRLGREYDRSIVAHQRAMILSSDPSIDKTFGSSVIAIKPIFTQHAVRRLFHTVQFGAGYMLMLLAMYCNGGAILIIFAGAYAGHFLTGRDTLGHADNPHKEACRGA